MASDYGVNLLRKGISQIPDKKKRSIANRLLINFQKKFL